MNIDLSNLLTILNATGIPLLAIALILLVKAYQKSGETYKETSSHLSSENERLRKRLGEVDASYFTDVEKMRSIVAKSMEAIEELQTRKIALLSKSEGSSDEAILADVEKINEAIQKLHALDDLERHLELRFKEQTLYLHREFQSLTFEIGKLAEHIGDTNARIAVVGVLASSSKQETLKSEVGDHKRGLISPVTEEPTLQLPGSDEEAEKDEFPELSSGSETDREYTFSEDPEV